MSTPLLTVFTPAYNRAYSLPRTFESLRSQNCKDFIWLVIDDGSTDNTANLVHNWQLQDNDFEIRYVYKDNGGMHTAHNVAYSLIDTELNVCIDSDDALAPNAVQIISDTWSAVRSNDYAGLLGLDATFDGKIIGTGFPDELQSTTLNAYYRGGGRGDKKLVLRTEVVRQFPPYPVFEGEKFVPLGSLYAIIDLQYPLYAVNQVLCLVEYLPDGSTQNMLRQYRRNPQGFRYSRLISMRTSRSFKRRFILHIHYAAESILSRQPILKDSPNKRMSLLAIPFGIFLVIYIKYRSKE